MTDPGLALLRAITESVARFEGYHSEMATLIAADLMRDAQPCEHALAVRAALLAAALDALGARTAGMPALSAHAHAARELRALLDALAPRARSTRAEDILHQAGVVGAELLAEMPVMGAA